MRLSFSLYRPIARNSWITYGWFSCQGAVLYFRARGNLFRTQPTPIVRGTLGNAEPKNLVTGVVMAVLWLNIIWQSQWSIVLILSCPITIRLVGVKSHQKSWFDGTSTNLNVRVVRNICSDLFWEVTNCYGGKNCFTYCLEWSQSFGSMCFWDEIITCDHFGSTSPAQPCSALLSLALSQDSSDDLRSRRIFWSQLRPHCGCGRGLSLRRCIAVAARGWLCRKGHHVTWRNPTNGWFMIILLAEIHPSLNQHGWSK